MSKPIQPNIPESAQRYFTNCRGVNLNIPLDSVWKSNGYLPKIRPSLWAAVSDPVSYPDSESFVGTNKTAQWWYYNSEDAENAISILRSNGINAVRVFLDYYVFKAKGNSHLEDIKNFLTICDKYKVRVQFVLWDQLNIMGGVGEPTESEVTSNPSAAVIYNAAGPESGAGGSVWGNVPLLFETSSAAQASNFFTNSAKPYIDSLARSVSSYQSMWSFDVQNESDLREHLRLISSATSDYINSNYSFIKTTIGNGAGYDPGIYYLFSSTEGTEGSVPNLYALSATGLDFASLHTYGNSAYWLKKYVREAVSGALDIGIPSMYNEASNYPTLNYPREVIKYLHRGKDYGGLMYQAFVERTGTLNPFNYTQGIYFSDGECRRSMDVSSFHDLAKDQWDFTRRQLNPNIVQKSASPDGLDSKGYTSGVVTGVIDGFNSVGVLPEHISFNSEYTMTEQDWLKTRNVFYGVSGLALAQVLNPGALNLNSYRYNDVQGSLHSTVLNDINIVGLNRVQPKYSLNASDITIKDVYDAFYTLSSLPSLKSYGSTSEDFDARNNQVLYMSNVIFMLTRTLFAASGQHSTPNVLRESLYGTEFDDLSGINEVVSVSDRLAFSAAANGLAAPGSPSTTIMPAVDGRDITGLDANSASAFSCHATSSCIYTTSSKPTNPTMSQIDWEAYDVFYEELIYKANICISKLQDYGTTVNSDFSIF
tara:strand:- start:18810 stop:20933 length:2124 start_codon:yes stop_codon:yes gene_type:complete